MTIPAWDTHPLAGGGTFRTWPDGSPLAVASQNQGGGQPTPLRDLYAGLIVVRLLTARGHVGFPTGVSTEP